MSRSFTSAIVCLALSLCFAPRVTAADAKITIVRPKPLSTVIGDSEIQVLVDLPDGAAIAGVDLSVDGTPLATLTAPPWIVPWDAGDGSAPRRVRAVLRLLDGGETSSTVTTSALRVNAIERVDLVNLYMVVRGPGGGYVTGLTSDDFRVLEDGVPQRIDRFSATEKPLRVAIVLDTSASMRKGDKLRRAKEAALQFLQTLKTGDEGLVVTFADRVTVAQDLTDDRALLASAIESTEAVGGTALYDGIYRASRKLADFDGRRVMVLLSDGEDMAANGLEPGSLHTLEESLEQTLRDEVMVFAVGLGKDLDRRYVRRWGPLYGISNLDPEVTLESVLRRIADSTGGRLILAQRSGKLQAAFRSVADDLHHQYTLAYASTNERLDGKWREVTVDAPGRDVEVVTRRGYYAPEDDDGRRKSRRGPR